MVFASVIDYLSRFFKQTITTHNFYQTAGGCINQTYQLKLSDGRAFFCKINSDPHLPHLFQKEKNGLALLARQKIIKVPAVIDCATINNNQILLLEWVNNGEQSKKFWEKFGEQLAYLHLVSNDEFGLDEDNYMGSVLQKNKRVKSWIRFFIDNRLAPLLKECLQNRLLSIQHIEKFDQLYERLPQIFETEERPALLHGDLWSGNFICNKHSEAVLIDPAVYFGHRSVDLAMTTLFGSFDKGFYEAYHYHLPFPYNYREQWTVCNLYPLLIHLLLFGNSYLLPIEQILKAYV